LDCNRCGKCCVETSMQLSLQDVARLRRLGYDPANFTTKKGGFKTLRNVRGVCYFFDAKTSSCTVYANRPEGCRYYPIIYCVDEKRPIIDREVCPRTSTITGADMIEVAPKLAKLAGKLIKNSES
jgi:Fe-S-cluster containining protein